MAIVNPLEYMKNNIKQRVLDAYEACVKDGALNCPILKSRYPRTRPTVIFRQTLR